MSTTSPFVCRIVLRDGTVILPEDILDLKRHKDGRIYIVQYGLYTDMCCYPDEIVYDLSTFAHDSTGKMIYENDVLDGVARVFMHSKGLQWYVKQPDGHEQELHRYLVNPYNNPASIITGMIPWEERS